MNSVENNIINIQVNKEMTSLYKEFLEIIEDIKNDHEIMMQKISDKNGQEYCNNINYFTEQKFEQIRKRILDKGNENSRGLCSFLDFFDFIINKERVEEAAKQKKVTKKFVTNSLVTIK